MVLEYVVYVVTCLVYVVVLFKCTSWGNSVTQLHFYHLTHGSLHCKVGWFVSSLVYFSQNFGSLLEVLVVTLVTE